MVVDTICDATQERQDAVYQMMDDLTGADEWKKVDMMLVVGGFNSSNTSHLQEIPEVRNVPSFWVDTASRIDPATNTIEHRTFKGEMKVTKDWLKKDGPIRIGITSGASTPGASGFLGARCGARSMALALAKVFARHRPSSRPPAPQTGRSRMSWTWCS